MPEIIAKVVDILSKVPYNILKMLPTIVFVLIVIGSTLRGMRRGFRKSIILFINFLIAAGACVAVFLTVFKDKNFDTGFIATINSILGEGFLNNILKVDASLNSVSSIIFAFAEKSLGQQNGIVGGVINSLNAQGAYIAVIAEMLLRFIMFIALYIVFLVLDFILYTIYLLFFSERKRKKKINYRHEQGLTPLRYNKRRLLGSVVGATRGLIKATVVLSFVGSAMFIFAGGVYKDETKNTTTDEVSKEMQVVTNFYNFFKTYNTTGIGQLLENVKDANNIPYYLMIADMVSKGYIHDENQGLDEYILAREEAAVVTAIINEALDYMIVNNITVGSENYKDVLLEMLMDQNFESTLSNIIDRIASEELFKNLAKSVIDSFVVSYADTSNNQLLKIFFTGDDPLVISKEIFTKQNFKIILNMAIRGYSLFKELGPMNEGLVSLATKLSVNKGEIIQLVDTFTQLTIFSDPALTEKLNTKLKLTFNHMLEGMTNSLNGITLDFINDIKFVDTYDQSGNKVSNGELSVIINLLDEILDSQLLSVDFKDYPALITKLSTKDSENKSLIEKLMASDLLYLTMATMLDSNILGDSFTLYIPQDCKTTINSKSYISKEELLTVIDSIAIILESVPFETLTSDPKTAILNLDRSKIMNVISSKVLQGTIALMINVEGTSDMIIIPSSLQFYNYLPDGSVEVDSNNNKIINNNINYWLDSTDPDGKIIPGEVRKTINGILDLNLLTLITNPSAELDFTQMFDLTDDEITSAFKSNILSYTFTKQICNLDKTLSPENGVLNIPNNVFMDNKTINDVEKNIKTTEIIKLIRAFDVVLGENTSINNFTLNINDLIGKNNESKQDALIASSILHATMIVKIDELVNATSGGLSGVLSIPQMYQSPTVKTTGNILTDFTNNEWISNNEIKNLLKGIDALGISIDSENNATFSFSTFKTLNDEYDSSDLISESKLEVILQSYILYKTLSDKVATSSTAIVLTDEVYDTTVTTSTEKFVNAKELSRLIKSFNILNIDVDNATGMSISTIFTVGTDESYQSADAKIQDLLESRIFECTVAKMAYDNFGKTNNSTIVVIDKLAIDSELNNLSNWLSERNDDLDVLADTWKEAYNLLIAAQRLNLGDALDNGTMNLTSAGTILDLTDATISDIMKSDIVGYTLSKQITNISSLSVSNKILNASKMILDNSGTDKLLTTTEVQKLFTGLRVLTNYNPTTDSDKDLNSLSIEINDFFTMTDKYSAVSTDTRTKMDVMCESYILWLTISNNLFSQGKTSQNSSGSLYIPNVETVINTETISGYDSEDYIVTTEINNLLNALNTYFGTGSKSFSSISLSLPNGDTLTEMLKSEIMVTMLSKELAPNFTKPAQTFTRTAVYKDANTSIDKITKTDLEELITGIKSLFGDSAAFTSTSFSMSNGMDNKLIDLFSIQDEEQLILRATVSKTILTANNVPVAKNNEFVNSTIIEENESKAITMIYLTKAEILNLLKAYDLLNLDLNSGTSGLSIATLQTIFSNETNRTTVLASDVAWLIISDYVNNTQFYGITLYEFVQSTNPMYAQYKNVNINPNIDYVVNTYDYIELKSSTQDLINKTNLIYLFTGNLPII